MPVFKREGVIGYRVGVPCGNEEEVYHPQCFEKENEGDVTGVITAEQTEENIYLCNGCGKEIE